jgi:hypothetical protein
MTDTAPGHRRPVRDHAHHPVAAAVEGGPGAERIGTKDLGGRRVCAERRFEDRWGQPYRDV